MAILTSILPEYFVWKVSTGSKITKTHICLSKNYLQYVQLIIFVTKVSYPEKIQITPLWKNKCFSIIRKLFFILHFVVFFLVKFDFFNLNLRERKRENFDLFANASWQATKYQSSKYGIKWITITETEFGLLYLNVRGKDFHYLICPMFLASDYLTFKCTRL